jgi:alpha-beta hydrolase superfamily lysophospholipase
MAESWEQFEILDHPTLLNLIFYPRRQTYRLPDSEHLMSFLLPVEQDVSISCCFFVEDKSCPNILFFHGNGEVAAEYADIGQAFNRIGVNLFVADYRGYGGSGGTPSISRMIRDAHPVVLGFRQKLRELGFSGSRFIMGRSLGSASAIELAGSYPDDFRGLVIESGFCDVSDLLGRFGITLKLPGGEMYRSPGFDRVEKIKMPALIIHGEWDSIVPLAEGEKIYSHIGSTDNKMLVIEGADHNTIFMVGEQLYLQELAAFIGLHK